MTKVNAEPVFEQQHPTSYLTVGESIIGSTKTLVRITCRGSHATFYAKPEDETITTGSVKVKMHKNIAALFGSHPESLRDADSFIIDTDVDENEIQDCRSATIYIRGDETQEQIERLLKANNYLLHSCEEVIETNQGLTNVAIVGLEPLGFSTLRVTEETNFEFIDNADNMAETITALSGVESHKEMAESMDVDEIEKLLGESSEVVGTVSEDIDEMDESDTEEREDFQMK